VGFLVEFGRDGETSLLQMASAMQAIADNLEMQIPFLFFGDLTEDQELSLLEEDVTPDD